MGSSSTNMHIVSGDLLSAFYKLFCFRFCVSSDQWKNTMKQRFYKEFMRHLYMKIIVTIIPTNLRTNSLLSFFCPFVETKTKSQIFKSWRSRNEKYFLFFVYRELRSTSKVCQIRYTFIRVFSYMLLLYVL